jgi:L-aminopeptidase/D-esterase-like protein
MKEIKISDIGNIKIGNAQDTAGTGCTVIICENGVVAGVDVRGGAPASRETEVLKPVNMIEKIHAVVLAGGSAFGLDAASGVMEYLEKKNIGFDVQVTKVPIVCASSLFDLQTGDFKVRPDKKMGFSACENASDKYCEEGNVGAGTGASVGKILGMDRAMKSGLGVYGLQAGDLKVISIVVVNSLGDIFDYEKGIRIAGVLDKTKTRVLSTEEIMYSNMDNQKNIFSGNTTLGVVITNGKFNKSQVTKISGMAHDGFARSIRPVHTNFDGDTIYTLATCEVDADLNVTGVLAAETMSKAIYRAITTCDGAYGLKSYKDLNKIK